LQRMLEQQQLRLDVRTRAPRRRRQPRVPDLEAAVLGPDAQVPRRADRSATRVENAERHLRPLESGTQPPVEGLSVDGGIAVHPAEDLPEPPSSVEPLLVLLGQRLDGDDAADERRLDLAPHLLRPEVERAQDPANRLPDPLLVLDERETDEAFAAGPEADAGRDRHLRLTREPERELERAELAVALRDLAPSEHRP